MPVMDGYRACLEIRSLYEQHEIEQPYLIACSGNCEDSQIQKAWVSKFDELIQKPASVDTHREIFEQVLDLTE